MPDEPYASLPPFDPAALDRPAGFYEPRKRILACAPDVYERVKAAIEASAVAELFEVVENPWIEDGQVLSIDPALTELPPFEFTADPSPPYVCMTCLEARIWTPGRCPWCQVFAQATTRAPLISPITSGIGGAGF